ncbi:MAG: alpha-L-fucosidase [Bacteroidales bacterium]|nr:alpha-L-fucosidase [Bacteroidales bacterium]
MKNIPLFLLALALLVSCNQTPPPAAVGPLPAERQLKWHELEFYAFMHFNMNTFTDMEWGTGGESPELFDPTELDCRQWARVCKEAGMKGIILTAKHHDGFCLWPSAYTEHSVKNSPWKEGKGDVVRELADACREFDLELGLYLSPWDRNHADYGTNTYITYFRNQLTELMTNYGEVFEVWFDGANGGTGYYGGANEERRVDRKTYYDWLNTRQIVRDFQPSAVMFSDAGPGVRWVGNEAGWAGETNWSIIRKDEFYPGSPNYKDLTSGHEDGTHWLPAEVDVSIRPGWYYHQSEDHKVKSVKQLVDIYYHSIGRNASFLLNFPVDRRGLIHEKDVEQLMKMVEVIRRDLETDLARDMAVTATHVRGNARKYDARKAIDGDPQTYWASDEGQTSASLIIDFGSVTTFNRFLIQEYIPLGQRVKKFSIEAWKDNAWEEIAMQTTVGYKRILRFDQVSSEKLRLNILESKACPAITNIEVYHAPKLMEPPLIERDKQGMVTIGSFDGGLEIHYTTDGTEPSVNAEKYMGGIEFKEKGQVKAMVRDPETGLASSVTTRNFDICKEKWNVVLPDPQNDHKGWLMIDANEGSVWRSDLQKELPQTIVIDLGETLALSGFTYLPTQQRYIDGTISQYRFYVSMDGKRWGEPLFMGEFSNIRNSPVLQTKKFDSIRGRYIKFIAEREINDKGFVTIAELGVVTTGE